MTEQERALAAEARREYKRNWNRKNADKVKEHQERYWLKKGKQMEKEREGCSDGDRERDSR